MKTLLTVIASLFALSVNFGQGIKFEQGGSSLETILNKARTENKIVFLVAYSNSCHNCQFMSDEVYPLADVGSTFNSQYINFKFDVDSETGAEIAAKYAIRAYPSFLFLNSDGDLLHYTMGAMAAEKFVTLGEQSGNPDHQYFPLKQRFANGERSDTLLHTLAFMAMELDDFTMLDTVQNVYLSTQDNWLTKDNMELIMTGLNSIEQNTFAFFIQHRTDFADAFGMYRVASLSDRIALKSISMFSYNHGVNDFDLDKARQYGAQYLPPDLVGQYMGMLEVNQYMRKQQYPKLLTAAVQYFDKYSCYNGYFLNNIAFAFYENTEDKALLQKALGWSLNALELIDLYRFYDTTAALYFKLGNKEKATEYALKSLQKAEQSGANTEDTKSLLNKISGR